MRLFKNLYLVCGCMYGIHQNVYAFDSGEEVVLIDSGMGEEDYNTIIKNLKYWKLDSKPIKKILFTHAHCEHSGNASKFEQDGVSLYGHPLCAEALKTGNDRTAGYAFIDYGLFPKCNHVSPVIDGDVIESGSYKFTVIETPGHSDDSLVYSLNLDGRTILFTGDTLLCDKLNTESMLGWTGAVDYNQDIYVNSLIRLSEMKADTILPGHGEICLDEGYRMLIGGYLRARLLLVTQPATYLKVDEMFR